MKNHLTIFAGILAFTILSAFTTIDETDGFFRIDTNSSSVEWQGSKITGKTHVGTVNISEGGLQLQNGTITAGKFTIDMTSIACTDLEDPKWNQKLVDHLKDDDFFSVDKHKTANLAIKGTSANGEILADLTIKGITNEVSFPATLSVENGVLTAAATIKIDRSKFDVRYGSDSFFDNLGDKAIDNTLIFKVNLKGKA